MSTVEADTSTRKVVGCTVIVGIGIVYAQLPISQNGLSMALYAFVRAFDIQNELQRRLPDSFTSQFPDGIPLMYTIIQRISAIPQPVRDSVREAFAGGLQLMRKILAGVAELGLVISFAMAEAPMADATDDNWGLDEKQKAEAAQSGA
ncbi:hypothetical protein BDQ17DRAFT_1384032 [Cyathus striatus]|nr:hypothetical protein BDQ17DRAFT_1384032 [Cyathus striatus]